MKKFLVILVAFMFIFTLFAYSVLAGGDKVRGDKGTGTVNQNQNVIYGDPAFDGDIEN